MGTTGASPSTWIYFSDVQEIIGSHPINNLEDFLQESLSYSGKYES